LRLTSTATGPCVDLRRAAALSVAILSIATAGSGTALAQDQAPDLQQGQATGSINFNIAAQSLASALTAFGRQAGLQVLVDSASVQGKTSTPVAGAMSAEQALRQLLGGTGVPYRFTSPTAVTVGSGTSSAPGVLQLDPVQVQGYPVPPQAVIDNIPPPYAGGQVATGGQLGILGNRDVQDTPFNQTSYTAKKAQDQQAKTVRDVLIDDPSVYAQETPSMATGDLVLIRGFSVFQQAFGGLYGVLPRWSVPVELAERVEVLKGPSAMLSGMQPNSDIGGTINVVPKRAPDAGITQFTAAYSSSGQPGGQVDIGRRFGADNQFGVRFNGAYRAGYTSIDNNTDQRGLAALGLDFRGERVRLSADLGFQHRYQGGIVPQIRMANNVNIPWAPDARKNFGQPWNSLDTKDLFGMMNGEVDLTERITLYAGIGAHDFRYDGAFGGDRVTVTNFTGNFTTTPIFHQEYFTYLSAQAGLRARVDTGPINHEVAVGWSILNQTNGTGTISGTPYTSNLYNPVGTARPSLMAPAPTLAAYTQFSGFSLADTLSAANKRVQLTVGGRLQQVLSQNFDTTTGAPGSGYYASALTPAVALVVKPFWENVSFYGNYIQGLQQGTVVGATFANVGEVFPPFKATQYEAGVKVDWGKLTTTLSLFQITQPNTIVDVATNTLQLSGEQRNQGLELNFFGEPLAGVRLLGGLMLLDAKLTRTPGGFTDNWRAANSPDVQLRLAGEWDTPFVPGLTLSGRVVYMSSQYIDTLAPRRSIADWTRLDAGIRYVFDNPAAHGNPLALRFNVENILDSDYWMSWRAIGLPRTFMLSLTANF
jgi:iron complex outermembrane recepter protein